MRVLFDQGTPVPLAQFLVGHTVSTSAREGWSRYQNSDLLNAAEADGFDVLVTTDKNLRYQQNLTVRKIAIIVLLKQQWPDLRRHVHLVVAAIDASDTRCPYRGGDSVIRRSDWQRVWDAKRSPGSLLRFQILYICSGLLSLCHERVTFSG